MKLEPSKVIDFFPSDNRFLYYVAKKRRLFFRNEDDVESARFFGLQAIMRIVNSKVEFEDEKHLYAVVEKNVLWGIYRMIEWNASKKNSQDIRVESDFIMSDDEAELRTFVSTAQADTKEYDNSMEYVERVAQDVLDSMGLRIFKMTLKDVTRNDMANVLGITTEAIRQRQLSNVKKLRNRIYENDTTTDGPSMPINGVGLRNKSVEADEASRRSYDEASSFLNPVHQVSLVFPND